MKHCRHARQLGKEKTKRTAQQWQIVAEMCSATKPIGRRDKIDLRASQLKQWLTQRKATRNRFLSVGHCEVLGDNGLCKVMMRFRTCWTENREWHLHTVR